MKIWLNGDQFISTNHRDEEKIDKDFVIKYLSFIYVLSDSKYQSIPDYSAVFTCFDKNGNTRIYSINNKGLDFRHEHRDETILEQFLSEHLFEKELFVTSQRVSFSKEYRKEADDYVKIGDKWVTVYKNVGTHTFKLKRDLE